MSRNLKRRASLAFLISLTLTGCGSLNKQLETAVTKRVQATVKTNLPPTPSDCKKTEPHASVYVGVEALSVLKRERLALDRQNRRTERCMGTGGFYDNVRKSY